MSSCTAWSICLLSLLLYIVSHKAAASQLRGRQEQSNTNENSRFRITVVENIIRTEDGLFSNKEEIVAIPILNGVESPTLYSINLPHAILETYKEPIKTGNLFVSISHALIDSNEVKYGDQSNISVSNTNFIDTRRLSRIGKRTLAVLRVSTSNGEQVGYSMEEIQKHLFDVSVSLKHQLELCSNGNLIIESAGIYEVTVPGMTSNFASPSELRNKALDLFSQQAGIASANHVADHVIVILPSNDFQGFVGNAGVNHWVSTLNDVWSLDVMVYMHEFGHNLGLGHAFLTDNSADYSSYMSATGFEPNLTGPLKCYNGASNRLMGWFDDRTQEVDVFATSAHLVSIGAFSESRKSDSDPILIQIGEYSLQYNFASEFNAGTEILRNQVTISYLDSGKTIVEKDGLVPQGTSFTADNFHDSGKTLKVEACEKIDGTISHSNAMIIGISLGLSGSPCDVPLTQATIAAATTSTTATISSTVTTSMASVPDSSKDTKPICPNSAEQRVAFVWGEGTVSTLCNWISHHPSRQQVCERQNKSQKLSFQHVHEICQQECHSYAQCVRQNESNRA